MRVKVKKRHLWPCTTKDTHHWRSKVSQDSSLLKFDFRTTLFSSKLPVTEHLVLDHGGYVPYLETKWLKFNCMWACTKIHSHSSELVIVVKSCVTTMEFHYRIPRYVTWCRRFPVHQTWHLTGRIIKDFAVCVCVAS